MSLICTVRCKMPKNFYPAQVVYFGQLLIHKISLKEKFKIERKAMRVLSASSPEQCYLSQRLQDKYQVACSEGLFKKINGKLMKGQFNFALLCEENPRLLCHKSLHHSYLANGKKVFAMGSLTFKKGKLLEITNNSGHYTPLDEEMLAVIRALYTASEGSLQRYVSYCSDQPKIYSVIDLLSAKGFASVKPLQIKDDIDISSINHNDSMASNGSYVEEVDDEEEAEIENELPSVNTREFSNLTSKRRYGRDLNKKLATKYRDILNYSFFSEVENSNHTDDNSENMNQLSCG